MRLTQLKRFVAMIIDNLAFSWSSVLLRFQETYQEKKMKKIANLLAVAIVSALSFGEVEANEFIEQIMKDSPSKIACEIVARDGANKSYAIFHLMGFNDEGNLRYRGITANQIEIRVTSDGKLLSEKTPCLSEPVAFR